jgi:hypothetical protein
MLLEHLLGVVVEDHDQVPGQRAGRLHHVQVSDVQRVEVAADDADLGGLH